LAATIASAALAWRFAEPHGSMPSGENVTDAASRARRPAIGLPAWILVGAVLGILAGVVFGERAAVLEPIGSAYSMLLQMAVYPYLLCSLVAAMGKLTPAMAVRLLRASWAPYAFVWGVTLASIWLVANAIPRPPPPILLTPDFLKERADLLTLLIPANLFKAFERNYVPAIVVFALAYGIAIQRVARKDSLFEILGAIQAASVTIWAWVVRFAPFGVFALLAHAAGTIQPDRLAGLALYIGLFLATTLLLAFVVLPAIVAAVAPVAYRELLEELRPAFVLALVTTLSVAALPFVAKAAERIVERAGCPEGEEKTDVLQASLSISYVLAQLGNYFVYLLILYAAWYFRVRLDTSEQLLLPFWTVLSGLGSPSATVDGVIFLGSWLNMPSELVDLYLQTSTVTRYGQVALSVMGFSFATILVPLVYFRKVDLRPLRGLATLAAGAAAIGAIAFVGTSLRDALLRPPSAQAVELGLDPAWTRGVGFVVNRDRQFEQAASAPPSLDIIRERGVLRVGYNSYGIPFSYRNRRDELVGFDIAFAFRLARDLGVNLQFDPFTWQTLADDLMTNRFDIAMGGIYATDDRLRFFTVSRSYLASPLALIVPSDRGLAFLTGDALADPAKLRLAVHDDPAMFPALRRLFRGAQRVVMPNFDALPDMAGRVDAAVWTKQ
jgi:Na+/H+-dicarboxylate symporter/ABC-type amino acid transport substrate-binding protein